MKKNRHGKPSFRLLRLLPLLLCILLCAAFILSGRDFSADAILHYAPSNPWLAAGFLLFLYALKSLSIVFPLIVLNIVGGLLFSPIPALLLNMVGVAVELTVPYWVGRAAGAASTEALRSKYPQIEKVMAMQQGSSFFISFFLRVISCLPGDAVSMYLGAAGLPFFKYLPGSFLGTFPGIITATLIGSSIEDPSSPLFWGSILATAAISILSFFIYFFWRRSRMQKTHAEKGRADD